MPTPSERPTPTISDQVRSENHQVQVKTCSNCRSPIPVDGSTAILLLDSTEFSDSSIVCRLCQERNATARGALQPQESRTPVDAPRDVIRRIPSQDFNNETNSLSITRRTVNEYPYQDVDMELPPPIFRSNSDPESSHRRAPNSTGVLQTTNYTSRRSRTDNGSTISSHAPSDLRIKTRSALPSSSDSRVCGSSSSSPDPLVDITRLRVRSQGCQSIYPGAVFRGTQKSGRNSYDVTVNIVDVDFHSSFLCGYLCIRGLTDDWPELTTYFDAEIIGSRHGFRTRDWGATEQDDLSHWSCFPAFRHVKHELQKPSWTIDDRDRGAVFMRWKERFLVPNHRVQDISGASFAGFYYVCVDFNPQQNHQSTRPTAQQMPLTPEAETDNCSTKPERPVRRDSKDYDSSLSFPGRRSTSRGWRAGHKPAATMSGYYFHQNSEPYQQLSLVHEPEKNMTSFEFR